MKLGDCNCILQISQPERTNAPELESKAAYSTLHWNKSLPNANRYENKPLSGVLFNAIFVVTLNSAARAAPHDAAASLALQPSWHTHHENSQPTLGIKNLNLERRGGTRHPLGALKR
jgi:hypothetical protein